MKVWAVTAEVEVLVLAETEEDACRIAADNAVEAIRDDVCDARTWTANDAAFGTMNDADNYAPYHDGSVAEYLSAREWMGRLGQGKDLLKQGKDQVEFIRWARDYLYREADFIEQVQYKMSFRATPAEAIRSAADSMAVRFTRVVADGLPREGG